MLEKLFENIIVNFHIVIWLKEYCLYRTSSSSLPGAKFMAIRKKRRESVQQHQRRNLVKKREKVVRTLKMKLNKISFKRGKRGGGALELKH